MYSLVYSLICSFRCTFMHTDRSLGTNTPQIPSMFFPTPPLDSNPSLSSISWHLQGIQRLNSSFKLRSLKYQQQNYTVKYHIFYLKRPESTSIKLVASNFLSSAICTCRNFGHFFIWRFLAHIRNVKQKQRPILDIIITFQKISKFLNWPICLPHD